MRGMYASKDRCRAKSAAVAGDPYPRVVPYAMMVGFMIGSNIVSSQQDGLDKLARHARVVLVVIAAVQLGLAAPA